MDPTEVLKFRILMCLFDAGESTCTVTGISRTLQEEKYVISRAMIRMEQEGMIDRTNIRAPALTPKGRVEAARYHDRMGVALNHLLCTGVDLEHARKDACVWAMSCSDEMIDVIRASDARYRVKKELKGKKKFDGATLCEHLKNGTYAFPFIIYREHAKGSEVLSMANEGFEHPCTLYVEDGKGVIQLRVLPISEKSALNRLSMVGKVNKLEYFDSGRFVSAEFHGDVVTFPASILEFVNVGEGPGQVLHGSACLKMQCSVGIAHMPESKALFTILI